MRENLDIDTKTLALALKRAVRVVKDERRPAVLDVITAIP